MAWDEGNAILRAERIAHWAARWTGDQPAQQAGPLTAQAIADDWPYTTQLEGHPAFYGIVIAAGQALSHTWLPPLESARFGPILLFATALGALFYRLGRDDSFTTAFAAVATLLLLPRMFAHAHFACYDGPLTSCWILAWAAFFPARASRRGALLWAVALGLTLSTKATGWIAPLPFLAWALVYRDRPALRALALGVPIALLVFFLLNPPLWHHPIDGLARFFHLNLHRAQHGWNISILFLGRMHNLDYPLPWYNTLFWAAITVPVGILALAAFGIFRTVRHWKTERLAALALVHWAALMFVRALPQAPPHDGVRLFLPAFAFLAVLAGIGTARLLSNAATSRRFGPATRPLALATVLLVYVGSASSLLWYAPQGLSYYNLLTGGLRGATAAGMEPTYYWDALDRSVLDWLHQNTSSSDKICFAAGATDDLQLMRRWGTLRRNFRSTEPGDFRWYVLQSRPGAWHPPDHWLVDHCQPAFQMQIHGSGVGPWRLDVPLIRIYPYDQYLRARHLTASGRLP